MKLTVSIFMLVALLAALSVAGCIGSPAPAPTATATPAPVATATVPPAPTLIGKSDEAHIDFAYELGTTSAYDGLQEPSPNNTFFLLQVKVRSDKPVQTSPDWFGMEYKVNDTDSVHDAQPFSTYMYKYPTTTIGPDTDAAKGGLIFELPAQMAKGYPRPYYYMPLEDQQGQYKVYDKVYGMPGDAH